ncbi:deoxycytidylate deaminase [Mesobaculum littorinae]|uniref:Deoxycytidylate deaminase n=1 Tax=Mesobaculum littorinae TaxID=2486419 RepID=A0A438AGW0_9RHOB|nr:anti-phage dCTP deaminase [Mesobaculum littorinae]RVV97932.1 deoxycytidylate deaminase [Mesobaculum littorinae]
MSEVAEINCPELIFGLVGPIGVNMDDVQQALSDALSQVGYRSENIHLTKALKKYEHDVHGPKPSTLYADKIATANAFCKTADNGAAMAALAISEIRSFRQHQPENDGEATSPQRAIPKMAYIIRQLKREEEIELLRSVYGMKFLQVSVSLDKDSRIENLKNKLSRDHPGLSVNTCERNARDLVATDEHQLNDDGGETSFGQQVGRIFHLGDFFVDGKDTTRMSSKILDFTRSFFGDNTKSPSREEYGAYMAAAAALRSVDLSRQVGSAIFTQDGEVISLGCNEVPKANGGNYWSDDEFRARDVERGTEQNSVERQRIIVNFLQKLQHAGLVDSSFTLESPEMKERLEDAIEDALISDITEYGRMTHAEMSAICDAARLGRSLLGATMFVTTFPCHNCAKHIVASGIKRVVFIEPYPKSRAPSSHTDSIAVGSHDLEKVNFDHFEGISPKRYRDIFQKGKRRRGAEILKWYEGEPRPRIYQRENFSHLQKEAYAVSSTLSKLAAEE